MGKIVEFISGSEGGCNVTACMIAAAACLSAVTEFKVAAVQLPGEGKGLREAFDRHIAENYREEIYKKTGLEALYLAFRGGRLTADRVRGCALRTVTPGLDLFQAADEGARDARELSELMVEELAKAYDYVLADPGRKLTAADLTVCLLPQSKRAWKQYFAAEGKGECIYAVNGYMENSAANKRAFCLTYGRKLMALRYSAGFRDAMEQGTVAEFFKTMVNMGKWLPDHGFIEDVSALVKEIVKGGINGNGYHRNGAFTSFDTDSRIYADQGEKR